MPFEKSTAQTRRIIDLASEEASRSGHASVDTIHLLIGMLREGEGVAAHVLADAGVDARAVLSDADSFRSEADVSQADIESQGTREATWLDHHYAGTEHLLLAVCCLSDCRAARLLNSLGKRPIELCESVLQILGHYDDWDRWLADHPGIAVD